MSATSSLLQSSIFLLLVLSLSLSFPTVAATGARLRRMPGFIFTRARGRCTPQFWSGGAEPWPRMVPQGSTVAKTFGSRAVERYRSEMTLLESTATDDGGGGASFDGLLKQGVAALLNSYARRGFPYSPWEVKSLVIEALVSEEAAGRQAQAFAIANEACT